MTTDGAGNLSFTTPSGGVSIGDTITGATQGSVLFIDDLTGVLAQDNTNFYWDNTNTRLGIGDNQVTLWMLAAEINTIGIFRSSDPTARISFKDSTTASDTHVGIGAVGNSVNLYSNNDIVLTGEANGNITIINNLNMDGNLNHDGLNIGFFGTTPTGKETADGPVTNGFNPASATPNETALAAAIDSLAGALAAYGFITYNP